MSIKIFNAFYAYIYHLWESLNQNAPKQVILWQNFAFSLMLLISLCTQKSRKKRKRNIMWEGINGSVVFTSFTTDKIVKFNINQGFPMSVLWLMFCYRWRWWRWALCISVSNAGAGELSYLKWHSFPTLIPAILWLVQELRQDKWCLFYVLGVCTFI